MAYKKDQGRYARMVAFWSLFFLLGYGCIRADGLVSSLRSWIRSIGSDQLVRPWIEPFPIIERMDLAMALSILVMAMLGYAVHLWLSRPRVADLLIDTEGELRKVTWPTFADTWKGTLAVVVTVTFMLLYLTVADLAINSLMQLIMQRAG